MENLYKNFIKIDIMSNLNLENIVGFKAVDKDGNEQNVTVDEMVDMVSTRMVMALSETSTFAAAAATGNDVYENELPTVTDAANVRVLQSSGDAAKMTMQSLASKLGELIGVNDTWFRTRSQYKGSILQAPTGIYRPSPGVITDTLSGGGLVLVFRMDDNNACVFQVTGNGILAVRTMNVNNGKWSDWDTIANPSFPT
ncbi:hypothetical protein [Phocaeicola vulgatus]|uniref:hypothetical protein n=1 Tax=Phocaeicola vulgatus TaxID=821 RepID=UPI001E42358B|nr:hypothetical protein [Phocaeicola vulgatus]